MSSKYKVGDRFEVTEAGIYLSIQLIEGQIIKLTKLKANKNYYNYEHPVSGLKLSISDECLDRMKKLTSEKIRLGDIVRISENSIFYRSDDESNPINVEGQVIHKGSPDDRMAYKVKWDNGRINTYDAHDLELIFFDKKEFLPIGTKVKFMNPIHEKWNKGVIEAHLETEEQYIIRSDFKEFTININEVEKLTRRDKRMEERKEATDNIYKNLFEDYIMEFKDDLKNKVEEELVSVKRTLIGKIEKLESENQKLQKRAEDATKQMWEALEQMENKPVINFGTVEEPNEKLVHPAFHTMSKILGSQKRTYKNIMLVGPAGSGKTHLSSSVAEALKLDYYPMSVGSQTTKYDLMGFINAKGGYQTTPVREAFENGGILLLDEFDAAHAGVVTILNSLLSNEIVSFPDKQIRKHEKFVVVVACNTYGKGATSEYVGRNKLDAATLDRFITVDVDYDETLEKKLLGKGFTKIMKNINKIRQNAKDQGINIVVSPRASMNVADLIDGGFSMKEALQMAVVKGAPDTVTVKLLKGVEDAKK